MSQANRHGDRIERSVVVQGIATHLFEAGAPDAPPLLYLHGTFLGNLWLDFHQALAERFHVYAPDTPGFGLTPRPDWMRDMSDYTLYLRDLLGALGLERPLVVGHSLGGWMACELAVFYPERVGKLVLANAAGIRVKGAPIADLFAMNPVETAMACFDDLTAAAPLVPAESPGRGVSAGPVPAARHSRLPGLESPLRSQAGAPPRRAHPADAGPLGRDGPADSRRLRRDVPPADSRLTTRQHARNGAYAHVRAAA